MSERIRFQDRALGSALSVGSAVATRANRVGQMVDGPKQPNSRLLRWRLSPAAVSPDHKWYEFAGNSSAGRTPKQYPDVALFTVLRMPLDALEESVIYKPAVAYALGETAMMVGTTVNNQELLGRPLPHDEYSQIAMRIGKGTLRATVGFVTPDMHFHAFTNYIMDAERLPRSAVPPHATIV